MEYRTQTGVEEQQLDEAIFVGFLGLVGWLFNEVTPFPKKVGKQQWFGTFFFFFAQLHRDQKYVAIF